MKTYIPLNGLSGVAIAVLPSIICIQLTFSDGLGGGMKKAAVVGSLWGRSEGDSNSRIAFDDYTLSRRASSATRASLHLRVRSWQCEIAVAPQMRVQR